MPSDHTVSQKTLASRALSVAAASAVIGPLLYVAVTLLHPPGVASDHAATFRQYALSQNWIAIHLAQLACLVVGLAGLAGLSVSMLRLQEKGRLLALLAVALAAASIPTAIVLQSVDDIALKRAVDAWVAEGGTVGSASFAVAMAIRWVEEGLNAVLGLTMGSTVILAGAAMVRGAIIVAETGFSSTAQVWVLARNPAMWIWTAVAGVLMRCRLPLLDATLPTSPLSSD